MSKSKKSEKSREIYKDDIGLEQRVVQWMPVGEKGGHGHSVDMMWKQKANSKISRFKRRRTSKKT